MTKQDEKVLSRDIYKTTNYDQFRLLKGNRVRREGDIKAFAKVLQEEGNHMDLFPVEVNEDMHIIDGQKRVAAARLNGMPVYYVILPHTNVDTVIARNSNTQNWTWLDFAQSWAARDNEHYKRFIALWEEFHYNYKVLMRYCLSAGTAFDSAKTDAWYAFRKGDFKIKDYALTHKLLKQCQELFEESGIERLTRDFANAAYSFMRTPSYNHEYMLSQVRKYGDGLNRCYTQADYLNELEQIQNAKERVYAR